MIKLVAFDWNGVLIADAKQCTDAYNHVFGLYGIPPVTLRYFRENFEIPAKNFYLKHGLTEGNLRELNERHYSDFHGFYEKKVANINLRSGAKKLLSSLQAEGKESLIFSNHTVAGVERQLKRHKIRQYFNTVLASSPEAGVNARSKGKRLADLLKERSISSHEVLIVGDSPEEVEIGKELGAHTVAITGGYCAAHRLKESNPDYLISNLNQLIGIIEKLR